MSNLRIPTGLMAATLALLFASGCASSPKAQVIDRVSDYEAYVSSGKEALRVGDHVQLFRTECKRVPLAGSDADEEVCDHIEIGHGEVIQVWGNNHAKVRFPVGTRFAQGDRIQKHQH